MIASQLVLGRTPAFGGALEGVVFARMNIVDYCISLLRCSNRGGRAGGRSPFLGNLARTKRGLVEVPFQVMLGVLNMVK